jgi:hypothetical protein
MPIKALFEIGIGSLGMMDLGCSDYSAQKKAEGFELREPQMPYIDLFATKKIDIEGKNLWFWNE